MIRNVYHYPNAHKSIGNNAGRQHARRILNESRDVRARARTPEGNRTAGFKIAALDRQIEATCPRRRTSLSLSLSPC